MKKLLLCLMMLLCAAPLSAQQTRDFAVEATGGIAGSLIGFGAVYLLAADSCPVEDLGCNLRNAFSAIAVGTAGSAAGTILLGRARGTGPSVVGAIVGSIAGAAAGIGVWHLFTEEFDIINHREVAIVGFSVTQGIVTALGSRLAVQGQL